MNVFYETITKFFQKPLKLLMFSKNSPSNKIKKLKWNKYSIPMLSSIFEINLQGHEIKCLKLPSMSPMSTNDDLHITLSSRQRNLKITFHFPSVNQTRANVKRT